MMTTGERDRLDLESVRSSATADLSHRVIRVYVGFFLHVERDGPRLPSDNTSHRSAGRCALPPVLPGARLLTPPQATTTAHGMSHGIPPNLFWHPAPQTSPCASTPTRRLPHLVPMHPLRSSFLTLRRFLLAMRRPCARSRGPPRAQRSPPPRSTPTLVFGRKRMLRMAKMGKVVPRLIRRASGSA